jgi:hypothetical protein
MASEGAEQLSVERLIEVTVEDFERTIDSWMLFFLAAYSQIDPQKLAHELLQTRGSRLLDKRVKLSNEEAKKRDYLEGVVEGAKDYAKWLGERDYQPLKRDLVVSMCTAFENFLKTIAVAAYFAKSEKQLARLVYVPDIEFRDAHKKVAKGWDRFQDGRIKVFLEEFVIGNNVLASNYAQLKRINCSAHDEVWRDAFRLRNAIVHSRGRPIEQLVFGDEIFQPTEEAIISEYTLRSIAKCFRVVSDAFKLSLDDL